MNHQSLSLGKRWKLFSATLKYRSFQLRITFTIFKYTYKRVSLALLKNNLAGKFWMLFEDKYLKNKTAKELIYAE